MKTYLSIIFMLVFAANANAAVASNNQDNANLSTLLPNVPLVNACYDNIQGKCEKQVIKEIGNASQFLLYQADKFDSRNLADAIIQKAKSCKFVPELFFMWKKLKTDFTAIHLLKNKRVVKYINTRPSSPYNRIVIIDGKTVIVEEDTKDGKKYTTYKNNPELVNKFVKHVLANRNTSMELK